MRRSRCATRSISRATRSAGAIAATAAANSQAAANASRIAAAQAADKAAQAADAAAFAAGPKIHLTGTIQGTWSPQTESFTEFGGRVSLVYLEMNGSGSISPLGPLIWFCARA